MAVVSVAQNMPVQALGAETSGNPRVNDVIMRAFLGPQGTRPGSTLSGEQVGDYVAALAADTGASVHNQTLYLTEPTQVTAALAGEFTAATPRP
jgi:hypothetical protein